MKLELQVPAFWVGSSSSILNYPSNFFDLARNGSIKVHIADIERLSSRAVKLSNGTTLPADALICSTGWKYPRL